MSSSTVRLFFTFLVCGIVWFTTVSLLYIVYQESGELPVETRRSLILQMDSDVNTEPKKSSPQKVSSKNLQIHGNIEEDYLYDLTELDDAVSRYGPGENGQPVRLYGEKEEEAKETWSLHNYNMVVSNTISLERSLKDVRDERCSELSYPISSLPRASVVITFHNEAWTVLLRAVYSIVKRTPAELLKEIILVNDASHDDVFSKLKVIPRKVKLKVRQVDSTIQQGVARSQMEGAKIAVGDVIVFMDPKCEVNKNWLEPLLNVIKKDPAALVSPVIDHIDPDTFEYRSSSLSIGMFTWDLTFKWSVMSKADLVDRRQKIAPYSSPVISSSVFAISRKYLNRIGGLDVGMDGTMAAQTAAMELSLKIWMCRGQVKVVPCSRVGYINAAPAESALNDINESAQRRNRVRIAEAWMDEYANYFYTVLPHASNSFYGNISHQLQIRKRHQCHKFQWYLENIFPSLLATAHNKLISWGKISNKGNSMCLDSNNAIEGKPLGISKCQPSVNTQGRISFFLAVGKAETKILTRRKMVPSDLIFYAMWVRSGRVVSKTFHLTKDGELRWEELCIDLSDYRPGHRIMLEGCHGLGGSQEWKHFRPGVIKHRESDLCLDVSNKGSQVFPIVSRCMDSKDTQMWEFMHYERTRRTV